jgi:hypothetical protein
MEEFPQECLVLETAIQQLSYRKLQFLVILISPFPVDSHLDLARVCKMYERRR